MSNASSGRRDGADRTSEQAGHRRQSGRTHPSGCPFLVPRDHRGAVVARSQETGYHAPSRWPASDFKHGKKPVFISLEEVKWH